MTDIIPFIVAFDLTEYNVIHIQDETFFVLERHNGDFMLLRSKCPHRGGPLHLGNPIELNNKTYIECPWHNNKINVAVLRCDKLVLKKLEANKMHLEINLPNITDRDIRFSKRIILGA
jgi:nitrite reductase/ring-hydroxylating ferredoxin subunit